MGKVVFFALGVAVTVVIVLKGRELYRRTTPQGIQEQVQQRTQSLGVQVSEFLETMTDSMKSREAELRDELNIPEQN